MESCIDYPGAYPLITKEKHEIAEKLAHWICWFGPPKTIVSNQGTEFINDVLDGLCKNLNIPHNITEAYNPRAKGKVERLNQTLVR
jgi:hypothetical protein